MSAWINQGEPTTPYAFMQWKGTDVCMDFWCTCGESGHYDGFFAYVVVCPTCGAKWEMPHYVTPRRTENTDKAPERLLDIE